MEGHCWTGQSPQWSVVPTEEEEEEEEIVGAECHTSLLLCYIISI